MSDSSHPPVIPHLIIGTMARQGDHPDQRAAIYRLAVDGGCTTFDTAPLYGFGVADRLLGQALTGLRRESFQVFSKVGLRWDDGARGRVLFQFRDADGTPRAVRRDSRPESVVRDVDESLERLGLDRLDLVQVHHPDPDTPINETIGALRDLQRRGRISAFGVSNFAPDELHAATVAAGPGRLFSTQNGFNLLERGAAELFPHCQTHGIRFLAYSPQAGGLLGRARSDLPKGLARVHDRVLAPMASRYAVTPATLAVTWAAKHPGVDGVIVGVSNEAQLVGLMAVPALALDEHDHAQLTAAYRGLEHMLPRNAAGTPSRRLYRHMRRWTGSALRRVGLEPARLRRLLRHSSTDIR